MNLGQGAALQTGPYSVYAYVRERCGQFWGVTGRTMLRDEARAVLDLADAARLVDHRMSRRSLDPSAATRYRVLRRTISTVIIVLGVLVFVHELGHFVTAKWTGMKATQFFIGFGPRLWSFRKGETEYGVRALPLGAFVRIIGMNNMDEVPPETSREPRE